MVIELKTPPAQLLADPELFDAILDILEERKRQEDHARLRDRLRRRQ